MKIHNSQAEKNKFENDINHVWHQASNATMIMTFVSLGIFLVVFLVLFFLTRNRLETEVVIPFSLFASLIVMLVTQMIIRKMFLQKRKNRHA